MRRFEAEKMVVRMGDAGLAGIMLLIAGTGVSALFSASYHFGRVANKGPFFFFNRQILWMFLGAAGGFFVSRLAQELIRRLVLPFVLITVSLNIMTYVPGIGSSAGGASRWLEIAGFSFQPSELVRVALILYAAYILDKKKDGLDDFANTVLPVLIVAVVFTSLVYFQNDFSSAVYVFLLAVFIMFFAGVRWFWMAAGSVVAVLFSIPMILSKAYRIDRILAWLQPMKDVSGAGYQIYKARMALQNGGFLGLGLGQGKIKLGGLPAAHSDFVFAVLGEETGFAGILFVILLFTAFAVKGYAVALSCPGVFASIAAFGLTTSVYFQAMINIAVVCGVFPATGIPLPLFSAGGTSTMVTLGIFGLLMNFSRSREKGREELF